MRTNHLFLIDSNRSGHRLSVDGDPVGLFATLGAAEAEATHVARGFVAGATLRFELDFKSTLSDSEIRAAELLCPINQSTNEDSLCGSLS